MYKTSPDRRFQKTKAEIRRAYLDLVVEKKSTKVSVAEITRRADINRMTFYDHYDVVEDIVDEFVDSMVEEAQSIMAERGDADPEAFFAVLNKMMFREIDFFRFSAQSEAGSRLRFSFRKAIKHMIRVDFADSAPRSDLEKEILSDTVSAAVAYAYLDWLAGDYGDIPLDDVMKVIRDQATHTLISFHTVPADEADAQES